MLTCLQLREQKIPKLITIPFQASVLRWPSFHARFSTSMGFTFFCNFLLTFYLQTYSMSLPPSLQNIIYFSLLL